MKLLIHDFKEEDNVSTITVSTDDVKVISEDSAIHNCIGCFGCWVKTPAACVIRDNYGDMGEILSRCDSVTILSKCFYGGFSPFIKNVMDRSISYIHPYFQIINGEMHHRKRYENHFDLHVVFYGENITEEERQTAIKLVEANSINLHCSVGEVSFVKNISEIGGIKI